MHLLRSPLVRRLPDDWRETLNRIAKERGWPTADEPARLGEIVGKLSQAYNAGDHEPLRTRHALAARLGFSFARDVPKSSGAVRELVATGALAFPEGRPLRVLDLGAGLGASTWGVVLALEAAARDTEGGVSGSSVEATCVDDDEAALSVATAIASARRGKSGALVKVETLRGSLTRGSRVAKDVSGPHGPFDIVLIGQVLSELEASTDEERLALHVDLVRTSLDLAAPDGSVVVIEPALRERTRRLHELRDALLASPGVPLTVFAPCLHQAPCPARSDPRAWCHEDLDVDLPPWLVPVAKAAGLRWQGLTFSYLVLRKDGRTLRGSSSRAGGETLLRVVSEGIVTKGKREAFVCGDLDATGNLVAGRARVMRLDRDVTEANTAWDELARGDVFECAPPIDAGRPRIARETHLCIRTPVIGPQR